MNRTTRYITLTLAIGWLVGAACGVLFMRHKMAHRKHFERMRERFSKDLKLTPSQTAQMDALLQAGRQQLDALYAQTTARVEEVKENTRSQIRVLLTPEQAGTFDQLHASWEAKHKKHSDHD